jgi:hypothetical protein
MNAYKYGANGKYIRRVECQFDPLETKKAGKEVYLIPGNSTTIAPLPEKEGFNVVWNGSAWEYQEIPVPPAPPEPTLDEVKAEKIMEMKGVRDTKEVEPITTDKGIFDYDDKSRDRLAIARQALTDAGGQGTITWTTADNQRVPLGVADFAAINAAAATRSNELHVTYNELKQRVNAATTADEVRAIVWPQQEAAANES